MKGTHRQCGSRAILDAVGRAISTQPNWEAREYFRECLVPELSQVDLCPSSPRDVQAPSAHCFAPQTSAAQTDPLHVWPVTASEQHKPLLGAVKSRPARAASDQVLPHLCHVEEIGLVTSNTGIVHVTGYALPTLSASWAGLPTNHIRPALSESFSRLPSLNLGSDTKIRIVGRNSWDGIYSSCFEASAKQLMLPEVQANQLARTADTEARNQVDETGKHIVRNPAVLQPYLTEAQLGI